MKHTIKSVFFASAVAAAQFAFAEPVPYTGQVVSGEYEISTFSQFTTFLSTIRNYELDYAGSRFVLGADIDCEGGTFIVDQMQRYSMFNGTFDGAGHSISNFVNRPTAIHSIALFDTATNAVIRNLTLNGIVEVGESSSPQAMAVFVANAEGANAVRFENCHFEGSVSNRNSAAVFVGEAKRGEGDASDATVVTFTNCTAKAKVFSTENSSYAGGFVAKGTGVVAEDCTFSGSVSAPLGGGFAGQASASTFRRCSVRDATSQVGFIAAASGGDTFEDCLVTASDVLIGFVFLANQNNMIGATNAFVRCRVDARFGGEAFPSGRYAVGFASMISGLNVIEDCVAYGAAMHGVETVCGFVQVPSFSSVIRRCVGAVLPSLSVNGGAGFAESIFPGVVVEDCYSVYGPSAAAAGGNAADGVQGGFVRKNSAVISRSFALWPLPDGSAEFAGCGSFCGVVGDGASFVDCCRPAESAVGDVNNADVEGITALGVADFQSDLSFPNYDFEEVWRTNAPASSPFLAASTDADTNFWLSVATQKGRGRILVKDADEYVEPRESYPAGTVLTVRAFPEEGYIFKGWQGVGFADPTAEETTYTVKNVGVIGVLFKEPYAGQTEPGDYAISTFEQLTNFTATVRAYDYAGSTFTLGNDIDCGGMRFAGGSCTPSTFSGVFDGNGHKIHNFTNEFNIAEDKDYGLALFDVVKGGAVIRNLSIEGRFEADEAADLAFLTAFAACAEGENAATFENCHFNGEIRNFKNAAAFVGEAKHGEGDASDATVVTFTNCTANAKVFSTDGSSYAAGFVANGTGVVAGGCTFSGRVSGGKSAGFIGQAVASSFRGCRVASEFDSPSGESCGFAGTLGDGTLIEDCAAYGAGLHGTGTLYGFVGTVQPGSAIRSSVAAVLPCEDAVYGAGFANTVYLGSTVTNCYCVYGPRAVATEGDTANGVQGGFLRRVELCTQTAENFICCSFTLWPAPHAEAGLGCGSFCGTITNIKPENKGYPFLSCIRPSEAMVGSLSGVSFDNIYNIPADDFSGVKGHYWSRYDFDDVWRTNDSASASSPFLAASTDAATNFWTFAAAARGRGRILVKDGDDYVEPAEAYPAGTVLTVRAFPDDGNHFMRWSGLGFADPTAQETTYTVRNVCAITAVFAEPYVGQTEPGNYTISTFEQLTNFTATVRAYDYAGSTFTLLNDIDCHNYRFVRGADEPSTFSGLIDGDGHRIYKFHNELYILDGKGYGLAMFDVVKGGATIRNLTLEGKFRGTDRDDVQYAAVFANRAEGANAVTLENCHFTGAITNANGIAVFIGAALRNEDDAPDAVVATLRNCTADAIVHTTSEDSPAGGFVAKGEGVVATGCTFTGRVDGGKSAAFAGDVEYSKFSDCSVEDAVLGGAGFVFETAAGSFSNCTVRNVSAPCGFVAAAVASNDFAYCTAVDSSVRTGFVGDVNPENTAGVTNEFRNCRAGCLFDNPSGACYGFAENLNDGVVVEDCVAYGAGMHGIAELYGFVGAVNAGAAVRRCVGAVVAPESAVVGAGFASSVALGGTVEYCYSVCGPRTAATEGDVVNGVQGGFVRRFDLGTTYDYKQLRECFALWPLPDGSEGCGGCGSFCGIVTGKHHSHYHAFSKCYRPEETAVGSVSNYSHIGVAELSAEGFSTMSAPLDFENVWRMPNGVASSPYLAASTDADTNFWTFAAVLRGSGRVLVKDGGDWVEPEAMYPAGTVLTVRAFPDDDNLFQGWVGDGFADPTAQETTYTVRNVGTIAVTFREPYAGQTERGDYTISSRDQLVLMSREMRDYDYAGSTFTLYNDIDCEGERSVTDERPNDPTHFSGIFDGAGHTISNFVNVVPRQYCTNSVALFDIVKGGAVIKNLTLAGEVDYYKAGVYKDGGLDCPYMVAFVTHAEGANAVTFENCHFSGSLLGFQGVATFIGTALRSEDDAPDAIVATLTNCTANATLRSIYNPDSINNKDVPPDTFRSGGFIGIGEGVVATDCSFTGSVSATRPFGGFAGVASNCVFRACSIQAEVDRTALYDAGGVVGITMGESAFYDCAFSGKSDLGGFVGLTAGSETFSNCTVNATFAKSGFVHSIASSGTRFIDCSVEGASIECGFCGNQTECDALGDFGTNYFTRCSVANVSNGEFGFASNSVNGVFSDCVVSNVAGGIVGFVEAATDATFTGCVVMDSSALHAGFAEETHGGSFTGCAVSGVTSSRAGFVLSATDSVFGNCSVDDTPGVVAGFAKDASGATFTGCTVRGAAAPNGFVSDATGGNTFEDCSVLGTKVVNGFVGAANPDRSAEASNTFRRCRVGCVYESTSGACNGFAGSLNGGTLVEDCAAYGAATLGIGEMYGFVGTVEGVSTIRRCVGAVVPPSSESCGAGFVGTISSGVTVEDCYSVYGPRIVASAAGQQGGFVRSSSGSVSRCFALWPIPGANGAFAGNGAFCGSTGAGATFTGCFRPAASGLDDVNGADADGVGALTASAFRDASNFGGYDFEGVWRAPGGAASSPYLAASMDGEGNLLTFSFVTTGEGRILVNGEAPAAAYAPGTVLSVRAEPAEGYLFTGWVGDGFADPNAAETTYTVANIGTIVATFGKSIATRAEFTAIPEGTTDSYVLTADLDFAAGGSVAPRRNFRGRFFGRNHTISGVALSSSSDTSTNALFASTSSGAEIRDLVVASVVQGGHGSVAGLVHDIGHGTLVSNCHTRVSYTGNGTSARHFGLASTAAGSSIRILDCTTEGDMTGAKDGVGFVGSVEMFGGEIARCASYCSLYATNSYIAIVTTYGNAYGFAREIALGGGSSLRECFSAGVTEASGTAAGFADSVVFRDAASTMCDCYSTADVRSDVRFRGIDIVDPECSGYSYGIARSISGHDPESPNGVSNVWFGGLAHGGATNYSFAATVDGVALANCAFVDVDRRASQVESRGVEVAGVTAVPFVSRLLRASWTGYDFNNVWSMTEGATTPYFTWSLANGGFRVIAAQRDGASFTHPSAAAPGANVSVRADVVGDNCFFYAWDDACAHSGTMSLPSTSTTAVLADNHRTVRVVWGKAIRNVRELNSMYNNVYGVYGLMRDLDANGETVSPLGSVFKGSFLGHGYTISNLKVSYGIFGRLDGATVRDLRLAGFSPVDNASSINVGALAARVTGATTVENVTVEGGSLAGASMVGALVGSLEGGGATIRNCSAVGTTVTATGNMAGGLFGIVADATVSQCYAMNDVVGQQYVGGFAGTVTNSVVSECFALGTATGTQDNWDRTDKYVGGFAGTIIGGAAVSDSYSLVDVTGKQYVGGFAGEVGGDETSVTRCYMAGTVTGVDVKNNSIGTNVGGFVGLRTGSPTFTDCVYSCDDLTSVTYQGASRTEIPGISKLAPEGMRDMENFAAYHATGRWAQAADGTTQPYLAWSLEGGKMLLYVRAAGSAPGTATGRGLYNPGSDVEIAASDGDGSIFLSWTGSACCDDRGAYLTTVQMDNFRIVTAQFGKAITNVAGLFAVTNAPDAAYGLAADIDLSEVAWTPLCTSAKPFTGSFYGRGHKITGLSYESYNSSSSARPCNYVGLFGCVKNATLDGVVLEDVAIGGYSYTGALAGGVMGTSTLRDCFASGTVSNSYCNAALLVGMVDSAHGTTFENCAAEGSVVKCSTYTYNMGGLIGAIGSCEVAVVDCAADADIDAKTESGGFVGRVTGSDASVVFTRCVAEGDIAADSTYIGGFVGYINGLMRCNGCKAKGDVISSSSSVGGFVGYINYNNCVFTDCEAEGAVSGSESTGGFAGYTANSRYTEFVRCMARGSVTGVGSGNLQYFGGFIGSSSGDFARFAECDAFGNVSGGVDIGGFVGKSSSNGGRHEQCRAFGNVTASSTQIGGFVGEIGNSNVFSRCMAVGSVFGSYHVGGFAGMSSANGRLLFISECFALGDVTATYEGTWPSTKPTAGGFVGYAYVSSISNSYCLGTVRGTRQVGGFAGYSSGSSFVRCYTAGVVASIGTYVGGFIGEINTSGASTFADCALLYGGFHAIGSSTAKVSNTNEYISELDAAGFKQSSNFAAYLATDIWLQQDGVTQPYLAWSSPDGKLSVFSVFGGSASGTVSGSGEFSAGSTVAISATAGSDGFFSSWAGSTPYADPKSSATTLALDNHRVAAANFGLYLHNADELQSLTNRLTGVFGLANDIDVSGLNWRPIGDGSRKFTGEFYGFGHEVTGLVCTNGNSSYRGLFGAVNSAILDGITVSGSVFGSQYVGGLAGRAENGTVIRDCHAVVDVTAADSTSRAGGLVGACDNGDVEVTISGCSAEGSVTGNNSVGGLVGYVYVVPFSCSNSTANCEITASGSCGGFVGYSGSAGARYSQCRAFGGVKSSYRYAGGFVGETSASNEFYRCMAAGSVVGDVYVGGFAGKLSTSGTSVAECLAVGDATATTTGEADVGGFVGYVSGATSFVDSYCLGTVSGKQTIGGFVGYFVNAAGSSLTRCYAAGLVVSGGSYAGGFIGYPIGSVTFADCALLNGDMHAFGSYYAGQSTTDSNIAELDEGQFRQRTNFAAYHDSGVWEQLDGVTQPYLAWSAVGGKLYVGSTVGGSASGTVDGTGLYLPGDTVEISATGDDDGFFTYWAGVASYDDRTSSTTTITLDNHRNVSASFGRYIRTADELRAIANESAGVFGLAADIDLSDRDWSAIGSAYGDNYVRFTGELYGFGHRITGLVCTNSNASYCGLFGATRGATLEGLTLTGKVVGKDYVGGLIGCAETGTTIRDCRATVEVVSMNGSSTSYAGGLVGACKNGAVAVTISGCDVEGSVSGGSCVGGLVGYVSGVPFACSNCTAKCDVTASNYGGGFVGQSGSAGSRYEQCRAFGGVKVSNHHAGGFAGHVSERHEFRRCMATGSAVGATYVGGFAGYLGSGAVRADECLAIGDATATATGDADVGGFAGYVYSAAISNSYCLGTVRGNQYVGGFAGYLNSYGSSFTRCYAAGLVISGGSYAGGFIGKPSGTPFADCAVLKGDIHALGASSEGASNTDANIAELDADQFRQRANFAAYHDSGVWAQQDGVTQPYLAWSVDDGKFYVGSTVGGSTPGTVTGVGKFSPGDAVEVTATVGQDGFFTYWSGAASYADRTNRTTTISLDNHRIVSASFGRYIRTADELQALTNELAGVFGLAADIDISDRDWSPISRTSGSTIISFTGELYGFGHKITGLVCTNSAASYRGLFAATIGATIEDLAVTGKVVGKEYVGGLVGCAENGTTIRDCTVAVEVMSLNGNSTSYAGGIIGVCGGSDSNKGGSLPVTVSGCRSDGYVSGSSQVGGLVGYVRKPFSCTNSVVRGDVHATSNNGGGFVGGIGGSSVAFSDCWCSGAVWGSEATSFGSFVGDRGSASFTGCRIYPFANGLRPGCGYPSDSVPEFGVLTPDEIAALSQDWPEVARRDQSATPIRTKADLIAITNDLSGCYVLVADIDLGGEDWTPIGQNANNKYFTGEFYGHNHAISNFTVNATQNGAGLFGAISNGRVSNVKAYGTVTGSAGYVGGFAGVIRAGSLVDGCSFVGCVTNSGSSNCSGGFTGGVGTRAVVMRSFASAEVVTGSADYSGGFLGSVDSGYISDCYALSDVNSGARSYTGGFAGQMLPTSTSKIAMERCWCSGEVESTGRYAGAFCGNSSTSSSTAITNLYYDSTITDRKAQGNVNTGGSVARAGISPLTHEQMLHAANFEGFDFAKTWGIDEGESTPYLLTFLVKYDDGEGEEKSGIAKWLEDNGLPADTNMEEEYNGVPYLFHYIFGDELGDLSAGFSPITGISFDSSGNVVVTMAAVRRDEDVTIRVLSSASLTDWSEAVPTVITIKSDHTLVFPRTADPARFYKLTAEN